MGHVGKCTFDHSKLSHGALFTWAEHTVQVSDHRDVTDFDSNTTYTFTVDYISALKSVNASIRYGVAVVPALCSPR